MYIHGGKHGCIQHGTSVYSIVAGMVKISIGHDPVIFTMAWFTCISFKILTIYNVCFTIVHFLDIFWVCKWKQNSDISYELSTLKGRLPEYCVQSTSTPLMLSIGFCVCYIQRPRQTVTFIKLLLSLIRLKPCCTLLGEMRGNISNECISLLVYSWYIRTQL